MNRLLAALAFAAHKHRDQRRKDTAATPYINHPIALANVLANEALIDDTDTTEAELVAAFGTEIALIVIEVTDDKLLPKDERKRLQVVNAGTLTRQARIVKLADKICNLRDISRSPPAGWSLERQRAYFDWAGAVIDGVRDTHPVLEAIFDEVLAHKPDISL